MPGICGSVALGNAGSVLGTTEIVDSLQFGLATQRELFEDDAVLLGCVHLGIGEQQMVYDSAEVVVAFWGHLTEPEIPPGAAHNGRFAAAFVHDCYLQRGEAFTESLAGAFALALWDRRQRKLILMSDHLGLRPIFYAVSNGAFHFASEIKALLTDPQLPRRLDLAAIADFFYHSYVMGDKTLLQDVRLLPPASVLTWQDGRYSIRTYRELPYPETHQTYSDETVDRLIHDTLQQAVQRIIRPGMRYGLSLSGGLDSRWLAVLLQQAAPDVQTFTFGPVESDDARIAGLVAKQLGFNHQRLELDEAYLLTHAETITRLSAGMYNLMEAQEFPLSQQMAGKVDVAFGGLLGDIIFGHEMNPVYRRLRRQDVLRYWIWRTKRARLPEPLMARVFGANQARQLQEMALASVQQTIDQAPCNHGYQVAQYVNLRQRQRRNINVAQLFKLPYVEISHPLADRQVVEMALQLPPHQMVMERAYRRAMARYYPQTAAIPWTFALLPPTASVPRIMSTKALQMLAGKRLSRVKIGERPLLNYQRYFADYAGWSRTVLRPYIESVLFSAEVESLRIFDMDGLRETVGRHMAGEVNVTLFLGQALAVGLWVQMEGVLRPASA